MVPPLPASQGINVAGGIADNVDARPVDMNTSTVVGIGHAVAVTIGRFWPALLGCTKG